MGYARGFGIGFSAARRCGSPGTIQSPLPSAIIKEKGSDRRWNAFSTPLDPWKYFVIHAPRQTGKTSSLHALETYLNAQGKYRCLYVNFESAQASRDNVDQGM